MAWKRLLQFRLASLFFLTTICGILLAWYVDHYYLRSDIIGKWRFPTRDFCSTGYATTLEIRRNGTFTKMQFGRIDEEVFSGTYLIRDDGTIIFHIKQKISKLVDLIAIGKAQPEVSRVDTRYTFRCAVDKSGYLIMTSVGFGPLEENEQMGIRWESSYMPDEK